MSFYAAVKSEKLENLCQLTYVCEGRALDRIFPTWITQDPIFTAEIKRFHRIPRTRIRVITEHPGEFVVMLLLSILLLWDFYILQGFYFIVDTLTDNIGDDLTRVLLPCNIIAQHIPVVLLLPHESLGDLLMSLKIIMSK